jgi:Inner membrane protein YgaP-like, transmembrane domain
MIMNEGTLDRAIRVVAGLAILSLAFVGPHSPWAWLGLVPLLTGVVGFCPAYALLGVRTCKPNTSPPA